MRAALLAALLAVVLCACTGAGPVAPAGPAAAVPPPPQDVVAGAVRALAGAGSARVSAALDGGPTGPVRASGPVRLQPFAADLTATLGTRGAQVRVDGDAAWLRLGGSGNWQRLPAGAVPVGALTGALHAAPGLRDVAEQPGREDVDGVPAVRYTGTVDLAAARAAAPGPDAATRLDELAGLVSPAPRFTAWLGAPDAAGADRGRLLRLRLEPAGGAGALTVGFAEPGLPMP
ncbi:hypothetical protein H7X46_04360 [Pseudonocardia sp. C8]|uniref:hypothetical protein n=1 Tax=Pseudonocardia sp. C8 TaxID=2762759 RepID=UPI00164309CB|nr:hypothetical protein [Pseudonocardia sp. C8]MBC3190293.1 hypothetical protein [Pseudonocardia sp. C8]